MSLINRWKAPTPEFYKKAIRVSLSMAAGAAALLKAESLGQMVVPDFTFKLIPVVAVMCKNIIVAGIVVAAYSKMQKEDDNTPKL